MAELTKDQKRYWLEIAIDIVKSQNWHGYNGSPDTLLDKVYEKLLELTPESE